MDKKADQTERSTTPSASSHTFATVKPRGFASNPASAEAGPLAHRLGEIAIMPPAGAHAPVIQARGAESSAQRTGGDRPNNTGLPDNLKAGIEFLSGFDMSDVRVHFHSPRPARLQALAYTRGTDIHVAPGTEQHLPHEAWHVVQQKQGRVTPTLQLDSGVLVNDDEGLEQEADLMGTKASQMLEERVPLKLLSSSRPASLIVQRAYWEKDDDNEYTYHGGDAKAPKNYVDLDETKPSPTKKKVPCKVYQKPAAAVVAPVTTPKPREEKKGSSTGGETVPTKKVEPPSGKPAEPKAPRPSKAKRKKQAEARHKPATDFGEKLKEKTEALITSERISDWSTWQGELAKVVADSGTETDLTTRLRQIYDSWTEVLNPKREQNKIAKRGTKAEWETRTGIDHYKIEKKLPDAKFTPAQPPVAGRGTEQLAAAAAIPIHVTYDEKSVRAPTRSINGMTAREVVNLVLAVPTIGWRIHGTLESEPQPYPHVYWGGSDLGHGSARYSQWDTIPAGWLPGPQGATAMPKVEQVLEDYVSATIVPRVASHLPYLMFTVYAWPNFEDLSPAADAGGESG